MPDSYGESLCPGNAGWFASRDDRNVANLEDIQPEPSLLPLFERAKALQIAHHNVNYLDTASRSGSQCRGNWCLEDEAVNATLAKTVPEVCSLFVT